MALDFNSLKGKAQKIGPDRMKFQDGKNVFRIVSPIMPGYKYWLKTRDGQQTIPFDCLGFNREEETFDNKKKDWVKNYFPEQKCQWAYSCLVIDRADEKIKLLDLKKTLLSQIIDVAKDDEAGLGDPSHPETGWDIVVNRVRTGPKPFNVEYRLEHFKLKESSLSDDEIARVNEEPNLDELLRELTPDEQNELLKNLILPNDEDDTSDEEEIANELAGTGTDDDL